MVEDEVKKTRAVKDEVKKTRVVVDEVKTRMGEDEVKKIRLVDDEIKKTRRWRMRSRRPDGGGCGQEGQGGGG